MRYRCPVCGEDFEYRVSFKSWTNPHYVTYHGEFARWLKTRAILAAVVTPLSWGAFFIIVLTVSIDRNFWLFTTAVLIIAAMNSVPVFGNFYMERTFRRRWKDQHLPEK